MDTNNNSNKNLLVLGLIVIVVVAVAYLYLKDKGTTNQNPQGGSTTELTQEQRRVIVTDVIKDAKETMTIDVSSCKSFPEVAQFKLASTVTFKNQDGVSHEIVFTPQHKFTVPAKGEYKLVFDFFQFPGLRRYTCDTQSAGTVLITK